ncbi:TRADD-N-associated membrane domain-containing protein [Micromonospora viridifaciens]|nr:hypothetical protein [Micromonospora viridifaciens]
MVEALGIPSVDSPRNPDPDPEPEPDSNAEQRLGNARVDADSRSNYSSGEYHQNVTVNIDNGNTLSGLAELTRSQSDGNARLIIKYYAQGHRQASVSFTLSMIFAVAGFAIAVLAVVIYILKPSSLAGSVATAAVGAVTELVSVLFFRRADRGRDLMMELVDKLRDDREREARFIGALSVIEKVDSPAMKDALRAAAVLRFTESPVSAGDLATLASSVDGLAEAGRAPSVHVHGFGGLPELRAVNPDSHRGDTHSSTGAGGGQDDERDPHIMNPAATLAEPNGQGQRRTSPHSPSSAD